MLQKRNVWGNKRWISNGLEGFVLIVLVALVVSCSDDEGFVPKKRGYHRLDLPEHVYQKFDSADCPYSFEYSKHGVLNPDKSFMTEPYWVEISYPELSATLSVSYKRVDGNLDSLAGFFSTSNKLTHKHHIKASAIDEILTTTDNGYTAVLYELEGDVPTHFHWFVTDSTKNFLRVVLYFPTATKNDSLAPVIEYCKQDMMKMLNTVEWKDVPFNTES